MSQTLLIVLLAVNVLGCVANGIGVWRSKRMIARLSREAHRARLYGERTQRLMAEVALYGQAYRAFCEEHDIKPRDPMSLH